MAMTKNEAEERTLEIIMTAFIGPMYDLPYKTVEGHVRAAIVTLLVGLDFQSDAARSGALNEVSYTYGVWAE
jgi:hypothetical protein